jgi:hypothetical protein
MKTNTKTRNSSTPLLICSSWAWLRDSSRNREHVSSLGLRIRKNLRPMYHSLTTVSSPATQLDPSAGLFDRTNIGTNRRGLNGLSGQRLAKSKANIVHLPIIEQSLFRLLRFALNPDRLPYLRGWHCELRRGDWGNEYDCVNVKTLPNSSLLRSLDWRISPEGTSQARIWIRIAGSLVSRCGNEKSCQSSPFFLSVHAGLDSTAGRMVIGGVYPSRHG